MGAARLLNRYGPIEAIPENLISGERELALLFKRLATLRIDAKLFDDIEELHWRGPTPEFSELCVQMGAPKLSDRAGAVLAKMDLQS
jgi:hypothetical protein